MQARASLALRDLPGGNELKDKLVLASLPKYLLNPLQDTAGALLFVSQALLFVMSVLS